MCIYVYTHIDIYDLYIHISTYVWVTSLRMALRGRSQELKEVFGSLVTFAVNLWKFGEFREVVLECGEVSEPRDAYLEFE